VTSRKSSKLSRRKFLAGSAATAAGAAVATSGISLLSERAEAFFNMGAFWKKPVGNGQTSNGYSIGQSLRFNGTNSYLSRNPATQGSLQKFTFSFWLKPSSLTTGQQIINAGTDNTHWSEIRFNRDNTSCQFTYYEEVNTAVQAYVDFAPCLRDPSAWYHVVFSIDTTQATNTNRVKLYLNGSQVTTYGSNQTWMAQNYSSYYNGVYAHNIGRRISPSLDMYLGGYLAEFYSIDGQALDASYFGQLDTSSGQWIPKRYSGTFGTNGFYLPFNDATSTTTLGYDRQVSLTDSSKNNWTLAGLQTYDQTLDSPTNNFATLNPLSLKSGSLSNGSTAWSYSAAAGVDGAFSTIPIEPGANAYFEATCGSSSNGSVIGIQNSSGTQYANYIWWGNYVSTQSGNLSTAAYTLTSNSVMGIAVDTAGSTAKFYFNNTLIATVAIANDQFFAYCRSGSSMSANQLTFNFGQGGQTGLAYDGASGGRFKYTPPAGFKALCTANLSVPAIKNGSQHFNALTYTGNGYPAAGTQSVTGLSFAPDLVWMKDRDRGTQEHHLEDSVRGAQNKLSSSQTAAESTSSTYLTAFNSNGFSVGTDGTVNYQSDRFVAWCWKAGGAAVSNTTGTITSQVSANSTAGFNIVTFSGGGSGGTVGHGLGTTPAMCIFKARNNIGTTGWNTWHQNLTGSNYYLDSRMRHRIFPAHGPAQHLV
jgi:hypothetical protein